MYYISLFVVLFVFMVQQVQLIETDKVLQIECLINMMTVFPAKNKIKYDDRVGEYWKGRRRVYLMLIYAD